MQAIEKFNCFQTEAKPSPFGCVFSLRKDTTGVQQTIKALETRGTRGLQGKYETPKYFRKRNQLRRKRFH